MKDTVEGWVQVEFEYARENTTPRCASSSRNGVVDRLYSYTLMKSASPPSIT